MTDHFDTQTEIAQQSKVWEKVYEIIFNKKPELTKVITALKYSTGSEVIFTGAGSSFFVGEIVAGIFQKNTGLSSRAVSTTEIVTHPYLYINPGKETLLVSIARSGNSPESIAAVELSEKISNNIYHLIITCNEEGELAKFSNLTNKTVLTMPEETNDKGLAMTSSVTSMALAIILFSRIDEIKMLQHQVLIASEYVNKIIADYTKPLQEIAKFDFRRAIFLGSGPFIGVARESHLKLQELTDGNIICKFDSFLSFRHGPKVVVDESTLVVYLFSNDYHVMQYEMDLANAVHKEHNPLYTIAISECRLNVDFFDFAIQMSGNKKQLDEEFLTICSLIPAQLLSFYKSIELGLNPDSPSKSGAIHRVVQGVTIYPFNIKYYHNSKKSEFSNG